MEHSSAAAVSVSNIVDTELIAYFADCKNYSENSRDVRKTEILFGFGLKKTEPSKNLTSVQAVFRQNCVQIRNLC